jgi:hypothetical protein
LDYGIGHHAGNWETMKTTLELPNELMQTAVRENRKL